MISPKYPNIYVRKYLMPEDVRALCIKYDYYTAGDVSEYENMFKKVTSWKGNDLELLEIAEDICNHSVLSDIYEDGTTFEMAVADTATTLATKVHTIYGVPEED